MQKLVPTPGRLAIMAGFTLSCFGLLLYLWVSFGGPVPFRASGYRLKASFAEAARLATEADVRISGVPVGKVKRIEPGEGGRSAVTIELESRYAPLPSDARAILRQKTLLGETYVELTPGSREAPPLPEGGELAATRISPTVELDEVFRAFDPSTRRALQSWLQSQAQALDGRGRDLSDAIANLAPFAEQTGGLLATLDSQRMAVRGLVRDAGEVFAALTERGDQLRQLIENANRVFATTAARDRELRETFAALPAFLDESRRTLRRLDAFAGEANPLVVQLRPAARELSPVLADLRDLAPDLEGFFRDLEPAIDASRQGLPALEGLLRDLRPLLAQLDPFLRDLNPMLDHAGLYKREATAFLANVVAATQATDRPEGTSEPLHYLRTMNPVNPEALALYSRRLGSNRPNPYVAPGGYEDLARGLAVFEDRHCGAGGLPALSPPSPPLLPADLRDRIERFFHPGTGAAAPPCRKQARHTAGGRSTEYPQVLRRPASGSR